MFVPIQSSASVGRSGARRVSLYDVLTGDSPLPPRAETATTATSEATAAGARGGGDGTIPAGCARRASIFDRIADVVFNEEQKDENPVDAVAVRSVCGLSNHREAELSLTVEAPLCLGKQVVVGRRRAIVCRFA